MFCRADGGRVAQITGPSALDDRILDSDAIFGGGQDEDPFSTVKHVTLAIRDVTFSIVLRIPAENDDFARDNLQKATGRHGILDRATGPPTELVVIYIYI